MKTTNKKTQVAKQQIKTVDYVTQRDNEILDGAEMILDSLTRMAEQQAKTEILIFTGRSLRAVKPGEIKGKLLRSDQVMSAEEYNNIILPFRSEPFEITEFEIPVEGVRVMIYSKK